MGVCMTFSHKEVVAALLEQAGVTKGKWQLVVNFGLGAMNAGPTAAESIPTACVGITSFGLVRATDTSPEALVIDLGD
jgi:hypothetical protein